MISSKIRKVCDDKKVQLNELAKAINLTAGGLNKILNRNDLKVSTLIEIASYLKVPVSSFFEKENQINAVEQVFETLKNIVKERMEK